MEGFRKTNFGSCGYHLWSIALAGVILFGSAGQALADAIPQKNVNAIGPAPLQWLYAGNPRMQQNESEGVESVVFPGHLAIGFNDYRGVNDPTIGEAFPGIAMSKDGGSTWISGLHPGHFGDVPNLGQKGGADPNLEIAPYMMFYNFIAFWRDGTEPPGVYVSRWYEPNHEIGAPFRHLDTLTVNTGTTSKFLDKPSFKAAVKNPADMLPDITVQIPAYVDPLNAANFHDAYTLNVPALRLHLCYSIFVGNDNNDGTKIECLASDDGGITWPIKNKLSESVEINQGTSIATRNFGQDVVVAWTRFQDNNETAAVMYAMSTDFGNSFSKAKVVTEFCPFNQSTGAARFRTNALPVIVSNDFDFAVYIASRNDASETCLIHGKGNAPDTPRMSPVLLADDFDSFGEEVVGGVRTKDGMVRTSLNFSRIMMVRGNGNGNLSWDTPVAIDAQEVQTAVPTTERADGVMARSRSHQFMPACDAAGGIETCTWYDSRLDKFNGIMQNLPAAPFVEDMVLHLEPGEPFVVPTLLPAGAYEGVPDPTLLPPNQNNLPLRRTIELFAAQSRDGIVRPYTVNKDSFHATDALDPDKISSPSVRVTRFPTLLRPAEIPGDPAVRKQGEWNYPNARLFRKGKSSFIGDYNTLFAQPLRKNINGDWVSNQSAPNPDIDLFPSREPIFHAGWTSNRNVRGKVFYTGCDTWNADLQMWEAGAGCDSPYTDPDGKLLPLQGEDGSNDGPPLTCSAALLSIPQKARAPLTRNQNIYTAALVPGISVRVVSAIKPADGGDSTYVLQILNGSKADRRVNLTLTPDSFVSFGSDESFPLLSIPVLIPGGSGNVRTVFDFGTSADDLAPSVIMTVTDALTGEVLARVPLVRASLETPLLGNVQSNPDAEGTIIDLLGGGEFYDLILKREIGVVEATFELENFELENTAELFDLENLDLSNFDLENTLVFFELENFELENTDLQNDLYQAFDLENTVINLNSLSEEESLLYFDLENFELENFDLENFDLENFELENSELEHFELENFDLENFELENETVFASSIDNFELENFELENAVVPGDDFAEISWTADSSGNTTTGVDVRPIFSPSLAADLVDAGTVVVLTVRRGYLNGTISQASSLSSCSAEIVVENQILYAAILSGDQILASAFHGTVGDPDPLQAETPGFFLTPDASTVVSLRFINPPPGVSFADLNSGSGAALFTQPGNAITCDAELPGVELDASCEVDFTEPDTTAPVITVNSPTPDSVDEDTGLYNDPGATASDEVDGVVAVISSGWSGDTVQPGIYTITYTATDAALNTSTESRTVTVLDKTAPVLTLADPLVTTTEAGFPYSDPGATALDEVDGVVTVSSNAATVANTSTHGTSFTVIYDATDAAGNPGSITRTVTVTDTIVPFISPTLVGGALNVTIEAGTLYVDEGATVTDNVAPPPLIVTYSDAGGLPLLAVNTDVVGNYFVHYNATDAAGLPAIEKTRTVTVADNTDPIIVTSIPPTFTPTLDNAVVEPNADPRSITISWPIDVQDLEANLSITCEVDGTTTIWPDLMQTNYDSATGILETVFVYPFPVGTSNVTCTVTDQGSNSVTTAPFDVTVEDRPIIDLSSLPTDPFTIEANSNDPVYGYVGPTAGLWSVTASDGIDGASAISAICTPAMDLAYGVNTISCFATDGTNHVSDEVTFVATVVDTTAPVISTMVAPVTKEANAATGYVWPGVPTVGLWGTVFADDIRDGTVEAKCEPVAESNFVLTSGENPTVTTVICVARDAAGNPQDILGNPLSPGDPGFPATAATTFNVTVKDSTPPVFGDAGTSPLPADILLEQQDASGFTPASPLWTDPVANAALDIVDGLVAATCTGAAAGGGLLGPTNTFPPGDTLISCSSTDSRGNPSTMGSAFTVTVGDSTKPVVSINLGVSYSTEATGPGGASVSFTATATDLGGSLAATCTVDGSPALSPYSFPLGDSVLACMSTDAAGNQGATMTIVSVVDTTPPDISATPLLVETTSTSASVSNAQLEANISAFDLVDLDAVTVACLTPDPTVFDINEPTAEPPYYEIECTATDSGGNYASTMLQMTVAFKYDFFLLVPKGKIQAGSTLPVDFYYEDNNVRVDASMFALSASWLGPYEKPGCVIEGADFELGDGNDSGSSSFRWSASKQLTQFSWQTPPIPGNYKFTITPPGTSASTECISLK